MRGKKMRAGGFNHTSLEELYMHTRRFVGAMPLTAIRRSSFWLHFGLQNVSSLITVAVHKPCLFADICIITLQLQLIVKGGHQGSGLSDSSISETWIWGCP